MDVQKIGKQYQIYTQNEHTVLAQLPVTQFHDEQRLELFINELVHHLKATNTLLPVSSIGVSLLQLFLYQLHIAATTNEWLHINAKQLTVQLVLFNEQIPFVVLKIKDNKTPLFVPIEKNEMLASLQTNIVSFVSSLCEYTQLKSSIVFNQLGSKVMDCRDRLLNTHPTAGQQFVQLIHTLQCDETDALFTKKQNPFRHTPRYMVSPYDSNKMVMIRSSCCMFYAKENGVRCYNCPSVRK